MADQHIIAFSLTPSSFLEQELYQYQLLLRCSICLETKQHTFACQFGNHVFCQDCIFGGTRHNRRIRCSVCNQMCHFFNISYLKHGIEEFRTQMTDLYKKERQTIQYAVLDTNNIINSLMQKIDHLEVENRCLKSKSDWLSSQMIKTNKKEINDTYQQRNLNLQLKLSIPRSSGTQNRYQIQKHVSYPNQTMGLFKSKLNKDRQESENSTFEFQRSRRRSHYEDYINQRNHHRLQIFESNQKNRKFSQSRGFKSQRSILEKQ